VQYTQVRRDVGHSQVRGKRTLYRPYDPLREAFWEAHAR
jgi:hypothetical protein